MANPLMSIYSNPGYNPYDTRSQRLPYGGGIFNPRGKSTITPERNVEIIEAPSRGNVEVVGWMDLDTNQINKGPLPGTNTGRSIFTGSQAPAGVAPAGVAPSTTAKSSLYDKYKDPKTGEIMTPEEYAIYLGNKVPKGTGEISNYAGDAMANPNESINDLTNRARNLNNSRNDIATGATDPYKVGNQSGIAYSPTELQAIEKAYAGIYDPALNDVFSRMSDIQKAEAKRLDREDKVFATNEAIRQWRSTTGTNEDGSGAKEKSLFTQSQLNDGAGNSGLSIESFVSLDDDIKNFYINPPMGLNDEEKKVPMYQNFETYFDKVITGEITADEVNGWITESTLPASVKHYFIEQIPAAPEKKQGWFSKVWGTITGK
jgi:hypothetical protein